MNRRKRLGDMLIELNYITEGDLEEALKIQKQTGDKIGEILINKGFITEDDLLQALEVQLGTPRVYLDMITIDKEAVKVIPEALSKKYNVLAIQFIEGKLLVLMNDPLNIMAEDDVRIASGYDLKIALCGKEEISRAISKYYSEDYMQKTAEELRNQGKASQIIEEELSEDIRNAPAVKLVDSIIQNAVRRKASDIHIEPFEHRVCVRYRIDGELQKQFDSPREPLAGLVTRIKIMSNMDIAERRIPQDGRIFTKVDNETIDLRVSVLPTVNGEKIVIRILDKSAFNVDKEVLGIEEDDLEKINKMITKPHGIVLVTGPTGSGKSTTLYSLLKDLNREDKNIITVEDPVEFSMDGINQVNVNTKAGLTFASGLRSILRQDPDIVMLGEIRDKETAEIAVRAAITGHLVLSTIHTNDAPSSVVRLKDMGVAPYLVSSALVGIIAQRLIRKLCPRCKEEYIASDYEKEVLGLSKDETLKLYRKIGCNRCNNTGYKGRVGIYEIMEINKEIRELINADESLEAITNAALRNKMKTLSKSAINVILKGESTIEELLRVTLLGD
ncbi:Flp pilus assembly complex ATPase component TadA [Clostridium sp. Sa3CUN1]|uniref:Flp pilus assembly complex ATPase component TadA n=1 Tax=Clostridium gallinarum TaxID=2762246 RepID=A0ABR8Q6F9_9CLOT|nr:ATPase, T2SS/T4P/T4SS family [Clostridium gallinarum]MBD7916003.1 Flp pilus assembly complex ATPase component TadA [Clostridium gallinarum]